MSTKAEIYNQIAEELKNAGKLKSTTIIPAQQANLQDIPDSIHPQVRKALNLSGISQLYSHQVEAWSAYTRGENIILQTPTSSGKSISFLLPVIHECLKGKSALIFFNLKALAYDQSQKIKALVEKLPVEIRPDILNINGDIPPKERKALYTGKPSIICATPDVWNYELNCFQYNDSFGFREAIRNISIVITDEQHLYNGQFGSHFALLNRRLQVMMDIVGNDTSNLKYIFATATIGNSQEIAKKISNQTTDFTIIDKSGAAKSQTTFISLKAKNNIFYQTAQIAALLVSKGIVGICFCDSRELVKSLTSAIRKQLNEIGLHNLEDTISAFYGTMKPNQRNKIIQDIQNNKIKFIVATSALEAGLDIGSIDATVVHKYPGSILSFRQRAGRAGRVEDGLLVFIPSKLSVMDGYYGNNPEKLLTDPPEVINFNHNYEVILEQHIIACCKESKPTLSDIQKHFGEIGVQLTKQLIAENKIIFTYNEKLTSSRSLDKIHSRIRLRGNREINIQFINQYTGEEFESSNASSAIQEVYPGAIYPAQDYEGNQVWYKSVSLNVDEGKAILQQIAPTNNFTRPLDDIQFQEIKLNGEFQIIQLPQGAIRFTPVVATIKQEVRGFSLMKRERIWACINERCSNFKINLSPNLHTCPKCNKILFEVETIQTIKEEIYKEKLEHKLTTPCIRVEINPDAREYFTKVATNYRNKIKDAKRYIPAEEKVIFHSNENKLSIHTLAHQLMLSLPLVEHGANSKDIDFLLLESPEKPYLVGYFYDTSEHGTGMCDILIQHAKLAISKAKLLVENCSCEYGCSNCTTIHRCPDNNESLFKAIGLDILKVLAE
jgi:DEAD/DEAH box helicase domain-containing protein